jgi:hypothetical protein
MREFIHDILIPISVIICTTSVTILITFLAFFIIRDEFKNK